MYACRRLRPKGPMSHTLNLASSTSMAGVVIERDKTAIKNGNEGDEENRRLVHVDELASGSLTENLSNDDHLIEHKLVIDPSTGAEFKNHLHNVVEENCKSSEKPLALRKTPRAAAGSNMYRGMQKPRRASNVKSSDVSSITAEDVSPIDPNDTSNGAIESPIESTCSSATVDADTSTSLKVSISASKTRKRKARSSIADSTEAIELPSDPVIVKRSRKSNSASTLASTSPSQTQQINDADVESDCHHDGIHDDYCWVCHRHCAPATDVITSTSLSCNICPRSFHTRCLGGQTDQIEAGSWVCPECRTVLRAEDTDTRSAAMQMLDLEQLCSLLKFALARMKAICPIEFLQPVDLVEFPTYLSYVVQPMDLGMLENNLKLRMYGSTESFLADAKWLQHNCIVYNGQHNKLSQVAKSLLKVCRQEMAEIEVCPDCYRNAHTKRGNWFVETCNLPHLLIWAKLKGFPFWPGKAMRIVSGSVDVRFFGAHDRAWISINQCYLLSRTPPTPHKNKKRMFEQSMDELESHIRRLRESFGTFEYAKLRQPLIEQNIVDGLRAMLPQFKDPASIERFLVNATKPKSEDGSATSNVATVSLVADETSNNADDNASDSASRSSQPQEKTLTMGPARPREKSVRNLESTIERIFQKKNKSKTGSEDFESGDESVASSSNSTAAVISDGTRAEANVVSDAPSNSNSNSNTNSDDSNQSKDVDLPSSVNVEGDASSNAASERSSSSELVDPETREELQASNGALSDENSKTVDDGNGTDNDEEGGLVIDTSTEENNDDSDDNNTDVASKNDDRVTPTSSQASGTEAPDCDEDEVDDVNEDEDDDHEDGDDNDEIEKKFARHSRRENESSNNQSKNGAVESISNGALIKKEKDDDENDHNDEDEDKDDERKKGQNTIPGDDRLIRELRSELDRIKWRHRQEMAEARHNADLVLLEMRRSLETEKEREVAAVRRQAEVERNRTVRDAKRRQWCAVCLEEASLMCCWNTSYCDYPCQRKHWPLHVNTCPRVKTDLLEDDQEKEVNNEQDDH